MSALLKLKGIMGSLSAANLAEPANPVALAEGLGCLAGNDEVRKAPRCAPLSEVERRTAATIDRLTDRIGLANTGDVVQELVSSGFTKAQVHVALGLLDDEGRIELRPSAGGEFAGPNDHLAPPGPRGTIFAYIRPIRGREAPAGDAARVEATIVRAEPSIIAEPNVIEMQRRIPTAWRADQIQTFAAGFAGLAETAAGVVADAGAGATAKLHRAAQAAAAGRFQEAMAWAFTPHSDQETRRAILPTIAQLAADTGRLLEEVGPSEPVEGLVDGAEDHGRLRWWDVDTLFWSATPASAPPMPTPEEDRRRFQQVLHVEARSERDALAQGRARAAERSAAYRADVDAKAAEAHDFKAGDRVEILDSRRRRGTVAKTTTVTSHVYVLLDPTPRERTLNREMVNVRWLVHEALVVAPAAVTLPAAPALASVPTGPPNRSTRPVTCERCGETWPRDPALEVECPDCHKRIGAWCVRPSGHRAMTLHVSRERLAMAKGLLHRCAGPPGPPQREVDR